MGNPAVQTATCMCSFGAAPAVMQVTSNQTVKMGKMLAATIKDNVFPTFGMCSCMGNPTVSSATSAAAGVLTPMPCTPAVTAPWTPGLPLVKVCKTPLLNDTSKLMCSYGGVIQIQMTPAKTVNTK